MFLIYFLAELLQSKSSMDYSLSTVDPSLVFVGVVAFMVTVVSVIILLFESPFPNCSRRKSHFYVLFEFNIRRVFKSQSKETLATLFSGVNTILGDQCERPAVFLFLSTNESRSTSLALAEVLAQTVAVTFSTPTENVERLIMKGSDFSSFENYWDFHQGLRSKMETNKVAIVSEFQCVHPHVASVMSILAHDAFSPFPQSVIILLLDVQNFFSKKDLMTKTSVSLAETYLNHWLSAFIDSFSSEDLQRCICGRAVLISRENAAEIK